MLNAVTHTLREGLFAYSGRYLTRRAPVVIYSNGHSGSMALQSDLRAAGCFSFKVEHVVAQHHYNKAPRSTHFVKRHIFDTDQPAKIITLVRDPVPLMISWFFSKFPHLPAAANAAADHDLPALRDAFLTEYVHATRYDDKDLRWFEHEFEPALGIDVYQTPFDTAAGCTTIAHPVYPTIILRTELSDNAKTAALRDFLTVPHLTLTRKNARAEKSNSDLYTAFKQFLTLPQETLEHIYTSRYATHFMSEDERATAIARWSDTI